MSLGHIDGDTRPGRMGDRGSGSANATDTGGTTLVTGTSYAAKPVYDTGQIITALTTKDGAALSLAWSTDIITYSINIGQIDPTDPEYTDEMAGYVAMTVAMEATARAAFELWDLLIAVDLLEMDDWSSAHVTFNYSSNTGNSTYGNYTYWLVDNSPRSQYKFADADILLGASVAGAEYSVKPGHGGGHVRAFALYGKVFQDGECVAFWDADPQMGLNLALQIALADVPEIGHPPVIGMLQEFSRVANAVIDTFA
jgi:hypothetical protein